MKTHPALRFKAPSGIQAGVPLKKVINRRLVALLAESMEDVVAGFDTDRFIKTAQSGLDKLEFSARGRHIAQALAAQLSPDFSVAGPQLVQAMGPELTATAGNGLSVFFYLPHSSLIAAYGIADFNSGMAANYALTKRMTAEYSVRPFIVRYRERALKKLLQWAKDPNPHVRRLVSEGTRPRLPWAMRLADIQENPQLTLPLLEKLKDDPALYVRRSVANHLGDIIKDHPETGFDVAEQWLEEARTTGLGPEQARARLWIVRHALRHPAKKGQARAVRLRAGAAR